MTVSTQKRLFVTPERCIGCRSCEIACSFAHATGRGAPGLTRIRAWPLAPETHVPVVCLQCENAACVQVCPTQTLVRVTEGPGAGAIQVLAERCIQCRMCTVACPFGNIHVEPANGQIVKCDLCGGDPACAKFCPTAALEWATAPTKNPPPKPQHTRISFPGVAP
jgi:Fe-S-cluster-containing hydrogenase component 2